MSDNFARYPSLNGKTVFITGGASGIGAEIVTAFPLIHEVYPAAVKKFQHSSGLKRSQISPIALMR